MSSVIAAYDLDEDHGRLWVNADLKSMPEVVIVANQPMDKAQTVTYVPETRLLQAMDAARETGRRADMAERVAADRKGLCDSLKETNDDLRRIIDELGETGSPADEKDRLRELVRDMWPHVRHRSRMCGECELPCDTSDECLLYEPMRQRMRELGIEVDA